MIILKNKPWTVSKFICNPDKFYQEIDNPLYLFFYPLINIKLSGYRFTSFSEAIEILDRNGVTLQDGFLGVENDTFHYCIWNDKKVGYLVNTTKKAYLSEDKNGNIVMVPAFIDCNLPIFED